MKITPWEVKLSDQYIAGFLDGDGSIIALIGPTHQRRFPYRVKLRVNFTQKKKDGFILEAIKKHLDNLGNIRIQSKYNQAELVIGNRQEVKKVLLRLKPFVIIKRNQLELALQIIAVFEKGREGAKRVFLTEREHALVMVLARKLRKFNSGTGGKSIR